MRDSVIHGQDSGTTHNCYLDGGFSFLLLVSFTRSTGGQDLSFYHVCSGHRLPADHRIGWSHNDTNHLIRTMETTTQRVYRSGDRIIAGVIGGFAERFEIEPTILRLAVVFLTVMTGIVPGVITYVVAMLIMPSRSSSKRPDNNVTADETTGSTPTMEH